MPPSSVPKPTIYGRIVTCLLLAGCVAAVVHFFWTTPWLALASTLLAAIALGFYSRRRRGHFTRLIRGRDKDDIGSFARSFDCHSVDTWIIRAVWEEFRGYLENDISNFPIRPDDRLVDDLRFGDILELEALVDQIAVRSGRSLEVTKDNPYYEKVTTIGNLVMFLNCQPRIAAEQSDCPDSRPV